MKRSDFLKIAGFAVIAPSVLESCADDTPRKTGTKGAAAADNAYEKIGKELAAELLQQNDVVVIADGEHGFTSPRQIAAGAMEYIAEKHGTDAFFAWEYGPDFEKAVGVSGSVDANRAKQILSKGLSEIQKLPPAEKQAYVDAALKPVESAQAAGGEVVFMDLPEDNPHSRAIQDAQRRKDEPAFNVAKQKRLEETQRIWSDNIKAAGKTYGVVIGGADHFTGQYDVAKALEEKGRSCGVIHMEAPSAYVGAPKVAGKDANHATVVLQDEMALGQLAEFRRTLDKRAKPGEVIKPYIQGFIEAYPKCSATSELKKLVASGPSAPSTDAYAEWLQQVSGGLQKVMGGQHLFNEKLGLDCKDNANLVAVSAAVEMAIVKAQSTGIRR